MNKQPPTAEAPSSGFNASLLAEQVRLLNDGAPTAVAASLMIAAVTGQLLWDAVPQVNVLAWGGLLVVAQTARLALFAALRHAPNALTARRWRAILRTVVLLGGLTWGMLPVFLCPADVAHQAFLAFIAVGVTGAALAALAPDRVSLLLFSLSALLPLIVRLVLEGGEILGAMAALVSLYLGFIATAARRNERSIRSTLVLREQVYRQNVALREAQRLAHLGNWSLDTASGRVDWSAEVYSIYQRDPAVFQPDLTSYYRDLLHPDDVEAVRRELRGALRNPGQRYGIDHRILLPDGSIHWVHVEGVAVSGDSDQSGQITGMVQDITERVEFESLLRKSQMRVAFAIKGAGDGIWDWDMLTGEMLISEHYEAMLGYDKGEIEPTNDAWTKNIHADDLAGVQQQLKDYLEGKLAAYAPELRLRCKDGSYKWILCRGTVAGHNANGEPTRMIGIHTDISERKRSEQILMAAREAAERASLAKTKFLSNMSHELRTPMNAILGFGQLMESDHTLSAEHRDSVHEILSAGSHLMVLINELLDLTKVESGHTKLSLVPVEVSPIVGECLSLVAVMADQRGIQIGQSGLVGAVVCADPTRLKQVLLNLLSNAIKYNREGGGVMLDVASEGSDRLCIRVTDTGQGIPSDRLAESLLPFNRLDAEGSDIEGTGIGLTITRHIVELMGGAMDIESEVGVGTTFRVDLPLESIGGPEHGR